MKSKAGCDLAELYSFFGKKWSHSIFTNIGEKPIGYNELYSISRRLINPTLLSNRLKEMIRFKLIDANIENNRKTYVLTLYGKELKKIFHDMKKWSQNSGFNIPDPCKNSECACSGVFKTKETH